MRSELQVIASLLLPKECISLRGTYGESAASYVICITFWAFGARSWTAKGLGVAPEMVIFSFAAELAPQGRRACRCSRSQKLSWSSTSRPPRARARRTGNIARARRRGDRGGGSSSRCSVARHRLRARGACAVAENPVRFCLSVCRPTIRTTSRDNVTKLLHSAFAVAFPRLLTGEECGIILLRPSFRLCGGIFRAGNCQAPAARRRSCAHRCHCELAIPRLARLR